MHRVAPHEHERRSTPPRISIPPRGDHVSVHVGSLELAGELVSPPSPHGVVLFAHGSGSSRHSPRNTSVAQHLVDEAHVATLLVDLLSAEEEAVDVTTRELRFDIPLLGKRLVGMIDWLGADQRTKGLPLGLFGASTGAAASLFAAASRPDNVAAIVSRGGRPDLASADVLSRVQAPTLLIVGENDRQVLDLNVRAMRLMHAECSLEIVPGASHLFEEPGALTRVASLASRWFGKFLGGQR
ncbi:MAG: hydrolase [Myxococcaceae bacterium]|jgi:pimeloyl-ACP methyl ester carboxylesterase|nr:hydrolase [Myxococcaceae bacterium]